MINLGITSKYKDKLEVKAEAKKESELILNGTIKPKRGQSIYEVCIESGECKLASFKSIAISYQMAAAGDFSPKKELIMKEGHIYIPAINAANAKAKFLKCSDQSVYYAKEPILKL